MKSTLRIMCTCSLELKLNLTLKVSNVGKSLIPFSLTGTACVMGCSAVTDQMSSQSRNVLEYTLQVISNSNVFSSYR